MNQQSVRVQWIQLIVLSGVHFLVDMFGNMLPAILPVLCVRYAIKLSIGGLVLTSLPLASNGVQILTGHMRSDQTKPLFLHVGVVLAASICLMALIPISTAGILLLVALGIVSGAGIAVAHPEGLRAVHTLDRISPALSTAVFMTSGFLGFASGGAISAGLVSAYGLKGLYPLVVCPVVGIVALGMSKTRLAVEHDAAQPASGQVKPVSHALPFWKVLLIGLPAAISTTVLLQLVPTHLNTLGFTLTFGGLSAAMFGWGSVAGPFFWAAIAHKRGNLRCSVWAFLLSVPFIAVYLAFVEKPAAIWLLFGVGFFSMSAYVMTITLARNARGLRLGQRMAFMLGGTWGIAIIAFLLLVPVADWVGTGAVLQFTPAGYVLSGLFALCVLRQHPEVVRPRSGMAVLDLPGEERTPV
jgi:hypothetical protein